ncbi:MAG: hypothetical protein RLZZ59_484, partial [Pseudomonadota bacterium]
MSLNHIAIIMDGNGRWAKANGHDLASAHAKGADSAEKIIEYAASIGVKHLTLYAFSTENWKRPHEEVSALMDLLGFYLQQKIKMLHEKKIRFRVIGDLGRMSNEIRTLLIDAEVSTAMYETMSVYLAFSYGGRDEVVRACNKILSTNEFDSVTEEEFAKFLDAPDMPDVDLMIRSGGDIRISNFLIWQNAYAELYFTQTLWPDFKHTDFDQAIDFFKKQKRNFGHNRYI